MPCRDGTGSRWKKGQVDGGSEETDGICECQGQRPGHGMGRNMGRGLVIISGCAHSGIINTIKHAQKITGVQEIYAVIGGFHLAGADEERMALTTEELRKLEPRIVRPGHCTGFEALCLLRESLGSRCRPLTSVDLIEF